MQSKRRRTAGTERLPPRGSPRRGRRRRRPTPNMRCASSCPIRRAVAPTSSRASCRASCRAALGQNIVIDNKGGAGGSVGTDIVAKAPADGYTVLFTLNSHTVNPAIYAKLPFDTLKDFEPVGTVASLPQILVANPQFPANNVAELIALAKAKPGSAGLCLGGRGFARAPGGRTVQAAHRHADDACALSRRRPGRDRRDGRAGAAAVGVDPGGGAVREDRQAQGAGRVHAEAQRRLPRRADAAGGRRAGLRGRFLVRDVRAGEDAQAGDRQAEPGAQHHAAGRRRSARSCWRRAARRWAARPRRWARRSTSSW